MTFTLTYFFPYPIIMSQKNARSPLSQVYDDKSPLEHMHCIFLLPIMRRHGLAHLVSDGRVGNSTGRILRETVLATDMGVHQKFMDRFSRMVEDPGAFTEREVRLLICQALIKCSDISNPVCIPFLMLFDTILILGLCIV